MATKKQSKMKDITKSKVGDREVLANSNLGMEKTDDPIKENKTDNSKTIKGPLYNYEANLITQINSIHNENFSWDLNNIQKKYQVNKAIYEELSKKTDFPPEFICALHYRESGCNFNTYLHDGQPLGTLTSIMRADGRYFTDFKEAALDALLYYKSLRKKYGITAECYDMAALMGFAEEFNGTGYKDNYNTPSPYLYNGTNIYISGKYLSARKYEADLVDGLPGVYILLDKLKE